jgi:hypothetical protein
MTVRQGSATLPVANDCGEKWHASNCLADAARVQNKLSRGMMPQGHSNIFGASRRHPWPDGPGPALP